MSKSVSGETLPTVIDVNERSFEQAVLARSRSVPVVVDFWAPWCGPCRVLGPVLERLANEAQGAFILAKVNVDENPNLARVFRVQGIPAVKAFRDGRVVDEFTGALPESKLRSWLKQLVPAPIDQILAEAAALEQSDSQAALARYQAALELDQHNAAALFGLGRLQIASGDINGAEALRAVPAGTPYYSRAQTLLELVPFLNSGLDRDPQALFAQVAVAPGDLELRYLLAATQARRGNFEAALDQLVAIVQRNRNFHNDAARRVMLALFELCGDDVLVNAYRRKLANALF